MFYMGEGETVYDQLLDAYKENKKNGGTRKDYLEKAAEIEGIYVPAFYDVAYKEDGIIEVVSYGGDTTGYQIPFNVHSTGNRVKGTFDLATKTFTADSGSAS